tara:strand:- start:988 stop:1722 length:735 start_codon:yes stop_codon:yes gene_type:complete
MATKKITELPALDSAGLDVSDVLAIVDISTGTTKKITKSDLVGAASSYTHPNHTGDVTSVADGAQTIAANAVTYAKMQDVSTTDRLLGRDTAGAGVVEEITPANARTLLGLVIGTNVQAYDADNAVKDVVQNFTAGQSGEVTALTDASTTAIDFADSNNFSLLTTSGIGSTRILGNPSNAVAGQSGAITITSDAASRLMTYASNWQFEGGTAPAITTDSGGVDILVYYAESATRISAKMLKALS